MSAIQSRVLYSAVPRAQPSDPGSAHLLQQMVNHARHYKLLTCFFLPFLINGNSALVTR